MNESFRCRNGRMQAKEKLRKKIFTNWKNKTPSSPYDFICSVDLHTFNWQREREHYKAREIKKFIIAIFFVVAIANAYLAFDSM